MSLSVSSPRANRPKITVVTPSLNQSRFIETTIRAILLQNYPNLEYIIVDGGSTDGTIDIIKKYEPWITHWISEADMGMYDAINKGFSRATGDIMAWSPASDLYVEDTFNTIASVFMQFPEIEWLTSLYKIKYNDKDEEIEKYRINGFNKKAFFKGQNCLGLIGSKYNIQQQSTFWRKPLWSRAGNSMKSNYLHAGDFELWSRFYQFADLYAVDKPLGIFRTHTDQDSLIHNKEYFKEAEEVFHKYGGQSYNRLEKLIRFNWLKRRYLNMVKYFPGIAYQSKIIIWDNVNGRWKLETRKFL